jgi:hypothetical protein
MGLSHFRNSILSSKNTEQPKVRCRFDGGVRNQRSLLAFQFFELPKSQANSMKNVLHVLMVGVQLNGFAGRIECFHVPGERQQTVTLRVKRKRV